MLDTLSSGYPHKGMKKKEASFCLLDLILTGKFISPVAVVFLC